MDENNGWLTDHKVVCQYIHNISLVIALLYSTEYITFVN